MDDVRDELASLVGKPNLDKRLKQWAKSTSAYDDIGDAIFVPAVLTNIAGQLMVYGHEAQTVKLDAREEVTAFLDMPWEQAIAEWKARGLQDDDEFEAMLKGYAERSDVARQLMLERIQDVMRTALQTAIADGTSMKQFADDVRDGTVSLGISQADPSYLDTVFRTNVQAAYGAGRYRAMTDPDVMEARPYVQYRTAGDALVRPSHAILDQKVWSIEGDAWHKVAPPNGFRCFPGSTVVQGRFTTAVRALYTGELVKLVTQSGRTLAVTPNHPVLTSEGFAAAGRIYKGQHVLGYNAGVPVSVVRDVDPQDAPTTIEQAFDALLVRNGSATGFRPVADDLYGDAVRFDGDVDVVSTDSKLLSHLKTKATQQSGDTILTAPLASGAREVGSRSQTDLGIGELTLAGSLPRRSALPLDLGSIKFESGPLEQLRLGSAANMDATLYKSSSDGRPRDSELVSDLLLRHARNVELDEVVSVERYAFHGYVYDLESPLGWVVAADIFTSNCRCSQVTLSPDEARGLDIINDIPKGGEPDPGFDGPPVARLETDAE